MGFRYSWTFDQHCFPWHGEEMSRATSKAEELVGRTFAVKACGKLEIWCGLTSLHSALSWRFARWAAWFSFVVAAYFVQLAFLASVRCEVTSLRVNTGSTANRKDLCPSCILGSKSTSSMFNLMLYVPNLATGLWESGIQCSEIISASFCEVFSSDDYATLVWDLEPSFTLVVSSLKHIAQNLCSTSNRTHAWKTLTVSETTFWASGTSGLKNSKTLLSFVWFVYGSCMGRLSRPLFRKIGVRILRRLTLNDRRQNVCTNCIQILCIIYIYI